MDGYFHITQHLVGVNVVAAPGGCGAREGRLSSRPPTAPHSGQFTGQEFGLEAPPPRVGQQQVSRFQIVDGRIFQAVLAQEELGEVGLSVRPRATSPFTASTTEPKGYASFSTAVNAAMISLSYASSSMVSWSAASSGA